MDAQAHQKSQQKHLYRLMDAQAHQKSEPKRKAI
jgi:hypothetical protein